MLTNTLHIELFLDRHHEDINWVSENIFKAKDPANGFGESKKSKQFAPLNNFTWSQFEWFCAQLLRQQGWKLERFHNNVSKGRATDNSEADIVAVKNNQRLFVSCKHKQDLIKLGENNPIPDLIKVVREHNHEVFDGYKNYGVLMTTNIFDQELKKFYQFENEIVFCDLFALKSLNSEFMVEIINDKKLIPKWRPKYGHFQQISQEREKLMEEKLHKEQEIQELYQKQIEMKKREQNKNQIVLKLNNQLIQGRQTLAQRLEKEARERIWVEQKLQKNQILQVHAAGYLENMQGKISDLDLEKGILELEKGEKSLAEKMWMLVSICIFLMLSILAINIGFF